MRIPESGPFEAPQDQTGQEKPFGGVMGKNHTPEPEHFSLFGQDNHFHRGERFALTEDLRGGILEPEDGISQRKYPTPTNTPRPNYDEFDPYNPVNHDRITKSYAQVATRISVEAPPTDPVEVFSGE